MGNKPMHGTLAFDTDGARYWFERDHPLAAKQKLITGGKTPTALYHLTGITEADADKIRPGHKEYLYAE